MIFIRKRELFLYISCQISFKIGANFSGRILMSYETNNFLGRIILNMKRNLN